MSKKDTDQVFEDLIKGAGRSNSDYKPLEFETSLDLMMLVDPQFVEGDFKPHKWQVWASRFLCKNNTYTKNHPLQLCIPAANGSGKDAFVIAPFAAWHACTKIRSRCIITSSSFNQLNTQTWPNIEYLCNRVNKKFGEEIFYIKHFHVLCTKTGAEIYLFCTDQPGRAEGFHPWVDYKDGELCLIANESKTISDEIFKALYRSTFNRFLLISSPGRTYGTFYDKCSNAIEFPQEYIRGKAYKRRVTAYDCPHIGADKLEQEKLEHGESDPWFQSARLALFTSENEQVMIPYHNLMECKKHCNEKLTVSKYRRAGLDLAGGGDENCLSVFEGNEQIGLEAFRIKDTNLTVLLLKDLFTKWGFSTETAKYIFADDGGIGQGILDNLAGHGWKVSRVKNQSKPLDSIKFGNRGAELWFAFKRLIEEKLLILKWEDKKLKDQLSGRYYKTQDTSGKIILESKAQAKSKGHPSPDRADATVLAFTGLTLKDFLGAQSNGGIKADKVKAGAQIQTYVDEGLLIRQMEEARWKELRQTTIGKSPNNNFKGRLINLYRSMVS